MQASPASVALAIMDNLKDSPSDSDLNSDSEAAASESLVRATGCVLKLVDVQDVYSGCVTA